MTYVIAQPCVDVKDKACIEECPVDCIYEGSRSLYIHPDECVDCGACEPVCPVEAIFYEDDTPEEWKDYYKANVEFFDEPRLARWRQQAGTHRARPPLRRSAAAAEPVSGPCVGGPLRRQPWAPPRSRTGRRRAGPLFLPPFSPCRK